MTNNIALLRWIIGAGALCLFVFIAAFAIGLDRAQAHGVQVDSDPPPDAQLDETPQRISVTFNEPIEPSVSTIQLWDQAGQPLELGPTEFFDDPKQMAVSLPEELPPGFYTVIWRNLSTIDGHTWSGSFPFTILGPGGVAPTGAVVDVAGNLTQPPSNNPSTLESAARWVVLLGSAVMLGGSAYVLIVASPAARTLAPATSAALRTLSRTVLLTTVVIAIFFVLEGSLLQLIVQADRLGGLGRADNLLVDTRFGHYLIARQALLAIALLAVGLAWRARDTRFEAPALGLLLTASFGVLLTQSLVSHAAASDGSFWATSVDVLHLLAASFWVGALVHIGLAMPRWLDELQGASRTLYAAESFRRFSLLALVSVAVLMTSGILAALVQFTSWDELWTTSYGWSMVGKLGAMLPLLAVAGLNALVLQPRVVEASLHLAGGAEDDSNVDPTPAIDALQRLLVNTVRAEAVLAITVLVAVAVLIQLQAPRTAAEAEEIIAAIQEAAAEGKGVLLEEAQAGGLNLGLRIDPGRLGANSFELELSSDSGDLGEVLQTRLEFNHEQEEVGGTRVELDLAEGQGAFDEPGEAGALIVSLEIDPAQLGENRFEVGMGAEFGGVGEVQEVLLEFEHEGEPDAGFSLPLELAGSLRFVGESSDLSLSGDWTATLTVRRLGEEDVQATFDVPISDPTSSRRYEAEGSFLSLPGAWTVTATVRRRGEDDVQASFDVPISESGVLALEGESGSIWQWPFEGARSITAIAVLAVAGAGAAGWAASRMRRRRS